MRNNSSDTSSNEKDFKPETKKKVGWGCLVWILIALIPPAILRIILVNKIGTIGVNGEPVDLALLPVLLGSFFLTFCVYMSINTSKNKKANLAAQKARQKEIGFIWEGTYKHVTGLPLSENSFCTISYLPDKLTIEGSGAKFNLALNQLMNAQITTDVEIQKNYVSSVGGAVGGALLFGPLGAIIGGRAKQKTNRIVTSYLIITYDKEGTLQHIAFEIISSIIETKKFLSLIEPNIQNLKKEYDL